MAFRSWLLVLAVQGTLLSAQPPAPRDWSLALREDALALHADIAANHPGTINADDPGFAARNDGELARALERAGDARSYSDYFFALRQYVASFDDGHMSFYAFGDTPNDLRWPGFATAYDGRGAIRVTYRSDDSPVPLGARLVGCDGLGAEAYSAATLGRMWGRWQLESQRQSWGALLFLDEGSRYIPQARQCRFEFDGAPRDVTLAWRPLSVEQARQLMAPREAVHRFDARILADGTRWYAIPSFDADPDSPAGKALPAMVAAMARARPSLAAAPAIVLDLRGNGGGSSDWSRQIAEILWGRAALRRLPARDVYVDWRASKANLAAVEALFARQKAVEGGLSPEMGGWFHAVIRGLGSALARGEGLWRQRSDDSETLRRGARLERASALSGPVYIVTDAGCGSACLDAVDLWRALGAIQVGRTTSADTLYMEVRQLRLPSGITGVSLPMKVYRGRPRGANEPAVPTHVFEGDISETAALERWVASLRARDSRLAAPASRF